MDSPEHQQRAIEEYFLGQSPPDTEIHHSEKVASESIYGMRHDVWDVHASDGRWWVITNPTNLYPHDGTPVTPSMDRALALHIGITARVLAGESRLAPVDEETRGLSARAWRKYEQAGESHNEAKEAEDFQAVGMRLREAMIAFVQEVGTAEMVLQGEEIPQRANFKPQSTVRRSAWARVAGAVVCLLESGVAVGR